MIYTDGEPTVASQGVEPGAAIEQLDNTETIDITPDWDGMRRWLLERVAPSSLEDAIRVAAGMGDEAPSIREIAEAAGLVEEVSD